MRTQKTIGVPFVFATATLLAGSLVDSTAQGRGFGATHEIAVGLMSVPIFGGRSLGRIDSEDRIKSIEKDKRRKR